MNEQHEIMGDAIEEVRAAEEREEALSEAPYRPMSEDDIEAYYLDWHERNGTEAR